MRHRVFGNQLGRRTNVVKALYKSLLYEVLKHGKIETTLAKAKAIQGDLGKFGPSRIIRLGQRLSDAAEMVVLELVGGKKQNDH